MTTKTNQSNIYQSLMGSAERFIPIQKEKPKSSKDEENRRNQALSNLIIRGNLEELKKAIGADPSIKTSQWWRGSADEAIEANQVEVLRWLIREGARVVAPREEAVKWDRAVERDQIEVFELLWQAGAVDWVDRIQESTWILNDLAEAPRVAKFVIDHVGIDVGLLAAAKASQKDENLQSDTEAWVEGLLNLSVEEPKYFDTRKVLGQLRRSDLEIAYPGIIKGAIQSLWEGLMQMDNVKGMSQYLERGIEPDPNGLIDLWYEAGPEGSEETRKWFLTSDTLVQGIKKYWPDGRKKYRNDIQRQYGSSKVRSADSLKRLDGLGFDLEATGRGGEPFIHRGPLNKEALRWLARNRPEIFACKSNAGTTLEETLGEANKILVRQEMVKGAVVSRKKPMRKKNENKQRL